MGFQSQNSEAARPMVFTTTLLLIMIVAMLNFVAIWLRARLRKSFAGSRSRTFNMTQGNDRLKTIASGGHVPPEIHPEVRNAEPVLEIDHFNLWYGRKKALHDICMPVARGKVTALIGPADAASRLCCVV